MITTTATRTRCPGNACPTALGYCCQGCPEREGRTCPPIGGASERTYWPCLSVCDPEGDLDTEARQERDDYLARGEHNEEWLAKH